MGNIDIEKIKSEDLKKLDLVATEIKDVNELNVKENLTAVTEEVKPEVEHLLKYEVSNIKNLNIYMDSSDFDFSMLDDACIKFEPGMFLTVLRYKTYFGKPSRWEADEMYQYQCCGWTLISAKSPK